MRTLHLWNRHDLKQLAQGVEFTFKIGDEIHAHRAEHAYNKVAAKAAPIEHVSNSNGGKATRRKHSDAFKRRAVARLLAAKKRGVTGEAIARDLGITRSMLATWAKGA